MKTNLFIAGACKSGTSFLHEFLGQQNDICESIPKEPYFFELPKENRDESAYFKKYFNHYNSEKYLVDGRHRTMFFSWIPQAIYDYNKHSRIIFILRDPINRAYSHWWMWYARNIIKTKFHGTIKNELKRISKTGLQMDLTPEAYAMHIKNEAPLGRMAYADSSTILESGYYYKQICRFKKLFNDTQLLIIDYEEILNTETLSIKLSKFLGVDVFPVAKNQVVNKAPEFAKSKLGVGKFLPIKLKNYIKNKLFRKQKIEEKSKKMLAAHYREENHKLYEEFGLDFVKNWF